MRVLSSLRASSLVLIGASFLACGDNRAPDDPPDAPVEPPSPADPTRGAWSNGFALPGLSGFAARVDDLVQGPDERLYAAGIFDDAAGVLVQNVAVWDGTTWAALGSGLAGRVTKLAFDGDGVLWAAVSDAAAGRGALARWDGTAWTVPGGNLDGGVEDLAIIDGGVVVVGTFTAASPAGANSIARFDSSGWSAFGDGTIDGFATAIAPFMEIAGGFCVAGAFGQIGGVEADNAACWNGAGWTALGDGLPAGIDVLARAPDGTWFAGGTLTFQVDPENDIFEAGIAVLGPRGWRSFEGGVRDGGVNQVRDIQFVGDAMLIAGNFNTADRRAPVVTRGFARWTQSDGWSEIAGGVDNEVGVHGPSEPLGYAIEPARDGGGLWIGGLFSGAGGVPATSVAHVATFAGQPQPLVGDRPVLGISGFVDAMVADGSRMLVGGGFRAAGALSLRNVGALDENGWSTPAPDAPAGVVRDMVAFPDGRIAIAGDLVIGAGRVAFAMWDGEAWATIGGTLRGDGYDLLVDEDGALWLAGDLNPAPGLPGEHVLRLDPTGWTAVGVWSAAVSRLARHDGWLVAAGAFRYVDDVRAAGIAVLDGGMWREHPGGGVDELGRITAMTSSPSLGLVVGGVFTAIGGQPAHSLARWDGSTWQSLGGGVRYSFGSGFVSAIAAHGDGLFAAGGFESAGDATVKNLAWFDGARWHDLDGGVQDTIEELVVTGDRLWVGGVFTVAGGRPSSGLALWDFR